MMCYVRNPDILGDEMRDLLENYEYNEEAILSYIGAVVKSSIRVDFYSRLIGRKGAYREDSQKADIDENKKRGNQIEILAKYLINRYNVFVSSTSNLSNGN
jgi:hypothetical protein